MFAQVFVIVGTIALLALIAVYHRDHDLFDFEAIGFSNAASTGADAPK